MSNCDFAGKGSMQSFVMQIMVVAFVLASYESLKLLSDYRELKKGLKIDPKGLFMLSIYKKTNFWSKIFAE